MNPVNAIKRYYEMETDEEFVNGDLLIEAGYIGSISSAKNKMLILSIALFILAECFCVCTAVCVCQNLEFYMLKTVVWEQAFKFQYVALIFAVIFLIAYIVVFFAVFNSIGKKESEWLEKVAPGLDEIRTKKLEEIIDKM